ncbi:MAG: FtsW/RodA/SpoVE family cell cycle protein, partial [Bacteroidota bacterium]
MLRILKGIQGDRAIWAVVALLAVLSFLPVYSASSNLVYVVGKGTTTGYLVKHAVLLTLGFGIIYGVHRIPAHFFKGLSIIAMPIVVVLLLFTLAQGHTAFGANASRWIRIPFVGITFQTSNLAMVVLMIYVARYFSKVKDQEVTFKESLLPLWLPVFLVVILILPANFSTAAILFSMVLLLSFLGGYPLKYLVGIVGTGLVCLTFFILTAKAMPDLFPHRVDTWASRIESFWDPNDNK